jgi:hypothetical protein
MSENTAIRLEHDAWGRLVFIDARGVRHEGVEPVRDFPVSEPESFISICDAAGRELANVGDLRDLPIEQQRVLEQDLARREFVPRIQKILRVTPDSEPSEWEVETDRGPTRFTLNSADDVRRIGPNSALVIDEHGIRYMIDDARTLDRASRRTIEHYL